jgi:chaperone required for assembly of F1-ATPase
MTGWTMKRFWTEVAPVAEGAGWGIRLDGRPLRTPAKRLFVVPTRALAEAVVAEWDAQQGVVRPDLMPHTRMANSALDALSDNRDKVASILTEYADTDLTCYRADAPQALVARQAEVWDPLLDWLANAHGARLVPRVGVMHAAQDPAVMQRLGRVVASFPAFDMAALHDLVALSGSLVIGLAAADRVCPREDLWSASRVDESWQAEVWGIDAEAAALAEARRAEFLHAAAFLDRARETDAA